MTRGLTRTKVDVSFLNLFLIVYKINYHNFYYILKYKKIESYSAISSYVVENWKMIISLHLLQSYFWLICYLFYSLNALNM